jgi:hypothetical protein
MMVRVTFSPASQPWEIQRMKPGAVPVLATTGVVTPMAAAQIGQRGQKIKP